MHLQQVNNQTHIPGELGSAGSTLEFLPPLVLEQNTWRLESGAKPSVSPLGILFSECENVGMGGQ